VVPLVSRAGHAGAAWLRRYVPAVPPRIRLICFPHAGGNASAYHAWSRRLPADVELVSVRYPGRQDRYAEPCVDRMDELADRVTEAVLGLADLPVALFGHSMGAAVAYEVTLRLEVRHGVRPTHLFVSGHTAPTRERTGRDLHERDDEAMLAGLRELGGMDPAVLEEPELLPLVLPSLRADLRLIETYRPNAGQNVGRRVGAPVTAYVGTSDPEVGAGDADAWRELTFGGFARRSFPGGHFYLMDHEAELLADVVERLNPGELSAAGSPRIGGVQGEQ